jgi:fatty acid amide hydrolase
MTELTERSATEMIDLVRRRTVSVRELVEAHLRRIEAVDPDLNAIAVARFEEALVEADREDGRISQASTGGALQGLPMTVKEGFGLTGTAATAGLRSRRDRIATVDSPVVACARACGAVIVGKTNLAQLLWFNETDNPLFGRTTNPWDPERSPGGSSGGEGAIIAAGGSALGIGTDSGGSVRFPAHCCGVHALKPTSGRLTTEGTVDDVILADEAKAFNQPGPLARHVCDLALFLHAMVRFDASRAPTQPAVPLGDSQRVRLEHLAIGVQLDGPLPSAPAVRRVLLDAAAALGACGGRTDEFLIPDLGEATRLYAGVVSADGGARMRSLLGADSCDLRVGRALELMGHHALSLAEYRRLLDDLARYRRRFALAMEAAGLDVLLCPAFSLPAPRHGTSMDLCDAEALSAVFNLLGMPAGVVAASRVLPEEELAQGHEEPAARATNRGSAGLPVGVQVVARHWREDVVLAVMGFLETHFRSHASYPATRADSGRASGDLGRGAPERL